METAINAPRTITRSAWGMPIRTETLAIDESGRTVRVAYGVPDTLFTCPAKILVLRGNATYGFVTPDETDEGEHYLRFIVIDDQRAARASYRHSIQS